jgi:hypothetical protein
MALFTPSESPAIVVKEVDLTGVVPNVQTSTGAIVGDFNWGPVQQATLVSNESGLVSVFGAPDSDNTVDFHSAAYFLRYSNSLQVVREVTTAAKNAYDANASAAPTIKNRDDFDTQLAARAADDHTFIAKYPGDLGNSLQIKYLHADSADATTKFDADTADGIVMRNGFDAAPGTSPFATGVGATSDELHVMVLDQDGLITGTKGEVLETFPFVSIAKNAKNTDGSSNFVRDVINNASAYIWMAGKGDTVAFGSRNGVGATVFQDAVDGLEMGSNRGIQSISLAGGVNSGTLTPTQFATGHDKFEDVDTIEVDMLIAPGMTSAGDHVTVVNDLVATAQGIRKDCVVVASPSRADIVGQTAQNVNAITRANLYTNSSYLFCDNNYLKVYDKYNDQYIQIPAASSTAGLMAATDAVAAPWFSPAGPRRGQYLGITALNYSPTKAERDSLYKAGVNPISNIPGQGVLLFGDKTKLARPSAFDRINVRRLFLGIERAIAIAARNVMFEFNDEFTRAEFTNIVEPFLREIQGRRGITDFRVVCDDTNNTAAVIDRNEFIANIFIKPARSINFVTLNFVAVRTGVDFEEVVGTV